MGQLLCTIGCPIGIGTWISWSFVLLGNTCWPSIACILLVIILWRWRAFAIISCFNEPFSIIDLCDSFSMWQLTGMLVPVQLKKKLIRTGYWFSIKAYLKSIRSEVCYRWDALFYRQTSQQSSCWKCFLAPGRLWCHYLYWGICETYIEFIWRNKRIGKNIHFNSFVELFPIDFNF